MRPNCSTGITAAETGYAKQCPQQTEQRNLLVRADYRPRRSSRQPAHTVESAHAHSAFGANSAHRSKCHGRALTAACESQRCCSDCELANQNGERSERRTAGAEGQGEEARAGAADHRVRRTAAVPLPRAVQEQALAYIRWTAAPVAPRLTWLAAAQLLAGHRRIAAARSAVAEPLVAQRAAAATLVGAEATEVPLRVRLAIPCDLACHSGLNA
jgi:hypothetical protein